MASSGVVKFACLVFMCMVVAVPYAEAAISCSSVVSKISPCLSYVLNGGALPPACCPGIKALNAAAQTTPDRQATCNCLKQVGTSVTGIQLQRAAALPGKCGVNIPFKISPATDCSKVH